MVLNRKGGKMSEKTKEFVYYESIRKLQEAVKTTLERGNISNDVKNWIEKTIETVNQDMTKIGALSKEKVFDSDANS